MDDPILPRWPVNGDPGVVLLLLLFLVAVVWIWQHRRR